MQAWPSAPAPTATAFAAPPPDYAPHCLHAAWFAQVHLW
jgi:hypothetical protein